ncbi:MAG: hypothetical protein K2X66_14985 [Cyanobacteria bacterium]|nr:hypothetical protein [Cyanobacteriota bacterium]
MTLFFAAKLSGVVAGQFGPKSDVAKRKDFQQLKNLVQDPELQTIINNAPDSIEVKVSPCKAPSNDVKISISVPKFMRDAMEGAGPIQLPLAHFANAPAMKPLLKEFLTHQLGMAAEFLKLDTTLKELQEEISLLGFQTQTLFPKQYRSRSSGKQLIKALKSWIALQKDPDIQKAQAFHQDYKTLQLTTKFKSNDLDAYLQEHGIIAPLEEDEEQDLNSLGTEDTSAILNQALLKLKQQEVMKTFEPFTPETLQLDIGFTHIGFPFPPLKEAKVASSRAAKFKTLSIPLKDLVEKPEKIKSDLLEAYAYWNQQLTSYVEDPLER